MSSRHYIVHHTTKLYKKHCNNIQEIQNEGTVRLDCLRVICLSIIDANRELAKKACEVQDRTPGIAPASEKTGLVASGEG
jgi:hypothetical protein